MKKISPKKKTTKKSKSSGSNSLLKPKSMNPKSKDFKVKLVSKQTAKKMAKELMELYPDADCELNYDNNYQLLTAVIMSAQTTDVQVNKVTGPLFKKYPNAIDLAQGSLEDIKKIIKPTGYYNAKANNIQQCAQALVENHKGVVPSTLEELIKLPGVGRKTANVVLGVAFGVPGWTVDTHVQRLSRRMGFSKNTDPAKIEMDLQKVFDKEDWTKLSITIIWHGRRLCYARKPDCVQCPINKLCPSQEAY